MIFYSVLWVILSSVGASFGNRVAVMDFEAGNDRLSNFIKMELTASLIERRIEVVARHSIEYIERELDFQMSGYVSEVSPPQSAGTFLDRGILFAMRGEYDMAIADFSDAI